MIHSLTEEAVSAFAKASTFAKATADRSAGQARASASAKASAGQAEPRAPSPESLVSSAV